MDATDVGITENTAILNGIVLRQKLEQTRVLRCDISVGQMRSSQQCFNLRGEDGPVYMACVYP